jgi:poly-gamma-glutamate synthesis protein (capsule biosynthesis protein)
VAAGALALVLVVLILALRGCTGGGSGDDVRDEGARGQEPAAKPVELSVAVSGDFLIHSPVFASALQLGGGESYDFVPLLRRVRPYIARADLALCHLETPISNDPPTGYPLFNAPAELATAIAKTGWDACDTASNHTLDQGQEGVETTLRELDRAGLQHTGSYASRREAAEPLIFDVEGVRIALLAYTTDTNGLPLPEPWSVNVAEGPQEVIEAATRARREGAEAVIVNMHWASEIAPEYVVEPSPGQEGFVRALLEAPEITALVGQGPHVVQPIERIAGKYVAFSEGNLLSAQGAAAGLAPESQDGMIALLELTADDDGVRVDGIRYVPTYVSQPDYTILPVGDALRAGVGDAAALAASYERTVSAAGRGRDIEPLPPKLP